MKVTNCPGRVDRVDKQIKQKYFPNKKFKFDNFSEKATRVAKG